MKSPCLILLLLVVACFSLAATLEPRAAGWSQAAQSGGVLQVLFGDGQRMLANHFFVKADASFHSGYYPSIFDQIEAPTNSNHMTAREGSKEEEEHEKQMDFLGKPRDWIDRFGRHFMIIGHTHLSEGNEREILPWLRISASLDPHRIDTYTVAAYWLRDLGKVREAEQFLREGLRDNPNSYDILLELGTLYYENLHELARARGVLELALRRWREQESDKKDPATVVLDKILINLAKVEKEQGDVEQAIVHLEEAKKVSPNPIGVQARIDELRSKDHGTTDHGTTGPH